MIIEKVRKKLKRNLKSFVKVPFTYRYEFFLTKSRIYQLCPYFLLF